MSVSLLLCGGCDESSAEKAEAAGQASEAATLKQASCFKMCDKLSECEPERVRMMLELRARTPLRHGGPLDDGLVDAINSLPKEEVKENTIRAVKNVELECRRQCQTTTEDTVLLGLHCLDVPCDKYLECGMGSAP